MMFTSHSVSISRVSEVSRIVLTFFMMAVENVVFRAS